AFLADEAAFRQKEVIERLERLLALTAQLEAEAQASGDASDRVLAGVCGDNACRDDQVASSLQKRAPMAVKVRDELRSGEHRVMPEPARNGARMARRADTFDNPVADIASDSRNDAHRQLPRYQHRPLLDMQLEPCREVFGINERLS